MGNTIDPRKLDVLEQEALNILVVVDCMRKAMSRRVYLIEKDLQKELRKTVQQMDFSHIIR